MKRLLALITGLLTSACCTSLPKLPAKERPFSRPEPGSREIRETKVDLHDAKRGRDVPVKLYAPVDATGKVPVVVFSHGIGEDRDSYASLGRELARHGYLAVHLTHAGTDRAMLQRGYLHLYRAVKDPRNWIARVHDVTFVLDQLAASVIPRPALGMTVAPDLDRVAVAGHSAGAFTAYAMGGLETRDGRTPRDPRVKVIVAMSMPRLDGVVKSWNVSVPVLNMTGTCDTSLIYRTFPKHRRIPFERSTARDQYLITIEGVNHDTFSAAADRHHALIAALTIAFLRDRSWFDEPGTAQLLGTVVAVEAK